MKLLLVLGALLVLGGASIILNAFHVHFPLFRVACGLALGWIGISLLLSSAGVDSQLLAFSRASGRAGGFVTTTKTSETSVLFASQTVDVSDLAPGERRKVTVLFSDVTLVCDPSVPVVIHASTAFGNTTYPDGSSIAFGERTLRTGDTNGPGVAYVDVATVFGSTKIVVNAPVIVSMAAAATH